MSDRYTWQESGGEAAYRAPNQDHLGWWAAAAMLVSILLHVIVFFALDQVKFALGIDKPRETRPQVIRQVEDQPAPDYPKDRPAPDEPAPKKDDRTVAQKMDDLDILKNVKDADLDMTPQIKIAEYAVEKGQAPAAAAGSPNVMDLPEASRIPSFENDSALLGRTVDDFKPAALGQMSVVVDPGKMVSDADPNKFVNDLLKRGAGGKVENGTLDGVGSIDSLIGLPTNELVGKTTMLSSDLLFEFNRAELRDSAKIGLQKLGMLIDLNPTMYCWIEGHTDLIGSDAANLELSKRRAEAVKTYLVSSMKLDGDRIITRGFGRYEPLVTTGTADQQAPNRRVEIKMRKTPPKEEQISAPKAAPVQEAPPATPPRATAPSAPPVAIKVMPNPERAIPVEVLPETPRPPRAKPIAEPVPEAPRALPIQQEPPVRAVPQRAIPVEEAPTRAVPVAEPVGE